MKEFVLKKAGDRKIDMEKIDTIVTKVCRDEMCIHKYLGGALDPRFTRHLGDPWCHPPFRVSRPMGHGQNK